LNAITFPRALNSRPCPDGTMSPMLSILSR
jgi:hypothetical protein